MTDSTYTPTYTQPRASRAVPCVVCQRPLDIRLTKGRKSGKPSIMLICPENGRHFRAFVTDQNYVHQVLERIEASAEPEKDGHSTVPTMDKVGNPDSGAAKE